MPINPVRFRAPYIPAEQAWAEADRVRAKFWPSGEIPVEVEEILWIDFMQCVPEDQWVIEKRIIREKLWPPA